MKQRIGVLVLIFLCSSVISSAQAPTAVVNGQVRDTSGAAVPNALVEVINNATNVRCTTETNDEGIYSLPNLPPGTYHIRVSKQGFKTIVHPDITLNVQDAKAIGFSLPLGPISDTVTVEGGTPLIDTESAVVSTVVDRQFAENLPMNGRSFQTLIQLTPGVVLVASNPSDGGQFSVNGQRAASNYWTVDGVSANVGASTQFPGEGVSGALGSFSALGGTNSLVSVDAMQEFRIQTSTYAPEFGRTPGAQISIVTRSGSNQFHGSLFEYFRNDILDANNWFNTSVTPALPKAQERQNEFGGTFAGPILRGRTFFFFSYEGLRLRLPQTAFTNVPDANARQSAIPALQPYLNAFPLPTPNTPDNTASGVAQFNASFSDPATLDAYSLRIDHKLTKGINIFGRYNYSPSDLDQRSAFGTGSLSTLLDQRITTQTATVGTTWTISPSAVNDFRVNYSRTNASSRASMDSFGGAVPLASLPFPSPFTAQNGEFVFEIVPLVDGALVAGRIFQNIQRQVNLIDNISVQHGVHALKFGVDFRRLAPVINPQLYAQVPIFFGVPSTESGKLLFTFLNAGRTSNLLFRNLGVYAQDTWRATRRLTLTYGLRWDVDFAPSSTSGPGLAAATGFNLNDLSALALAPAGTPAFNTPYGNVAGRIGLAYELSQDQNWGTVVRGGFGEFFDLATQETGLLIHDGYPFVANKRIFGGTFPLDPSTSAPPPFTPPSSSSGTLLAFNPNLKLPYTLQWNFALQQGLGSQQTISASYIGSVGRRLIQTAFLQSPNPNLFAAQLVTNAATSDYDALQLQFQRRLSHGLQALASYTWSHSIDSASAGSSQIPSNAFVPSANPNANRGPSDFDIRQAFSAGVTYEVPAPNINALTMAILRGWSLQSVIQARSAPPVDVYYSLFAQLLNAEADVRPDVVSGIPLYLYGPQYPGGKAFNNTPGAVVGGCPDGSQSVGPFCPPPTDANGNPLRQGNLGRNALRGLRATQWDFAVHREFPLHESLKLQFRAELFNVLNHPNFGQPIGDLLFPLSPNPQFGQSTQMLGQSLAGGNVGGGALSPLYQMGGPRSIQFALKLQF